MDELKNWLQNAKFEIFIPSVPLTNFDNLDKTKKRNFLTQGKTWLKIWDRSVLTFF
jgi:hypothetical protein